MRKIFKKNSLKEEDLPIYRKTWQVCDYGQKDVGDVVVRKRKLGRPKRMYLDVTNEDMQEVGAREDEVFV